MKILTGDNPDVWKFVFDTEFENAITESVLYRYQTFQNRIVLCISCQSGCKVGCTFCGTGKKFIRNLKVHEIIEQVILSLKYLSIIDCNNKLLVEPKKFQIMFMSMGEPFHNYTATKLAMLGLHDMFPMAQLLISTSAPRASDSYSDFLDLSKRFPVIGLQFSIHRSTDIERNLLIPYKNKLSLLEIREYGTEWFKETKRMPYCNYCIDGTNSKDQDAERLMMLFPCDIFCFTFSVVCSSDENMKEAGYRNLDEIRKFESRFIENGYNTRIFDPAGQDDIGGGCGQLFHVQNWIKNNLEVS